MKMLLILMFFVHLTVSYKFKEPIYSNGVSKAAVRIIIDFYVPETSSVSISKCADNPESAIVQDGVINEVLFNIKSKILVQLEGYKFIFKSQPRFYNVFFVDSYEAFR